MSGGRRLFPSRRTITPVLTTIDTNADPYYSPFEVYSSPIKAPQSEDDQLSNNDSLSSTGSIKIGLLSTLDLPPLEAETGQVLENHGIESSESIAKLQFDQTSRLSMGRRLPTTSAAKSTKRPPHTKSSSILRDDFYDPKTVGNSKPGQGNKLKRPDPCVERKPDTDCLVDLTRSEHHSSEIEAQPASASIAPSSAQDPGHAEDTIHPIDSWESSVKLCTNFLNHNDERIQINHHARLTVLLPKSYIAAERTELSIIVSNGIRGKHEMLLGPGQHSLFFQEDSSSADATSCKEGEIIIVRDTCDLDLPINLYLSLTYHLHDSQFMVASLPTFRPRRGKTLSEIVALTHPSPPLAMKPLSRGNFSTWKEVTRSFAHATYFERVNMPRLYPEGFKDDLRIKIWTPSPVYFNCLNSLQPCDLVWNFDMTVEQVIGSTIECDMNFNLQVGEADRLISIDPHGWAPKYFVIDGRLATEQAGEWRENENGLLTLFRRSGMVQGPMQVETHWQEPSDIVSSDCGSKLDLPLPRVTDLKVVGGGLTCRLDKSKGFGDPHEHFCAKSYTGLLVLGHSGASSGLHAFFNGPHARLPPMFPGYKMYLTPTSDKHLHHSDSVTEQENSVESFSKGPGGIPELGHTADYAKAPPLGNLEKFHPLTDRLPISPIAEENEPMELESKGSGGSPDTGDKTRSQEASYDEPNEFPPLGRSAPDTLLTTFFSFCLIFCVHFYVYPMYKNGLQRGSSIQEQLGHEKVQVLGCYEVGNDSSFGAYMNGNEAQTHDSQRECDVKALHRPHKDEAERARWEVVRDWVDHILDRREWQGYA